MAGFPSDASRAATTITTEHLALIGFAARLGTCVNNDATSSGAEADGNAAKSVRDEAMLLMSLLMGEKAQEILSEEIGARESRSEKRRRSLKNHDDDICNFSFTFPSLSLHADAAPAAAVEAASPADKKAEEDAEDLPPPSQLLRRTKSVTDKDGIRDSAEAMAHNVLESFGAALVWRAKTWVQSLARVLALKEQERIDALKAASSGKGNEKDGEEGADDSPIKEGNEDLLNSKEMQIIDAIVKSSEEVSVVNVKTSFRVLPNGSSSPKKPLGLQDEDGPAAKKAKREAPQDVNEYKVTHKLLFEATISMTSNDGVRYNGIKLQAPGYIQGSFTGKPGPSSTMEGEETLGGVSMTLDTDALALSLERQSRLVVRRAAEAALLAASGVDCSSSPRYLESPHVHNCVISPRYVLMSPVPSTTYADSGSSSVALPPMPTVNDLNGKGTSSSDPSNVVSDESDSSAATAASSAATAPNLKPAPKKAPAPHSPSFPALLSVANEELSKGG